MDDRLLNVPVLPESAPLQEAFRQMRAHDVSVSVIEAKGTYHLLNFRDVVMGLRESALRTKPLGALIGVQEHVVPLVKIDRKVFESWSDDRFETFGVPRAPASSKYGLLGVSGGIAQVAGSLGMSDFVGAPVMYECSVDPNHGPYFASDVGSPPRCPSKTHSPPRPAAVIVP
jgi:hypothetical protein